MYKIAVISDNFNVRENLKNLLSDENYLVGYPSLDELSETSGNVVIVDFTSLQKFIEKNFKTSYNLNSIPVLGLINTKQLETVNFILGVDDFVIDSTLNKEILLRIKQLLWKFYGVDSQDIIKFDNLIIDLAQHKVLINFEQVPLTYMEFKLLQFFVSNKNRVFSRNHILERVWGYDYYGGARTVDVHVRRLRSKLGSKYGQFIETVRNVGYKFTDEIT